MNFLRAARKNYGLRRDRKKVKYIVIHFTAGNGDSAYNEARYFSREHKPHTSAHFFVGYDGDIWQSVEMFYTAYSVGGKKYSDCAKTGGGKYYGKCTNSNSVSVELCDNLLKDPSEKQIKAVKEVIAYIQKWCPNAKTIIRHFDVNGKHCPVRLMDEKKWKAFKEAIK